MKLTRAVEAYLDDCRLRRRTTGTLRTYENSLGFLTRLAMLHGKDHVGSFTPTLVREYFVVASEQRENQTETLMRKRVALRGFAKWGLRKRLWVNDPMDGAPEYRKPGRLPRPFVQQDREDLMALPLDAEESALRAVLYYSGLRAAEVLALQIKHVVFGDGERPGRLLVHGKGNKERAVPMMAELEQALGDFLMDRVDGNRFVFVRSNGRPWTYRMLFYRVWKWGQAAGVVKCGAHRFRHVAATEMIEAGASLTGTQKAMGHASMDTTMLYVAVADVEVEQAMRLRSQLLERRAVKNSLHPATGAAERREG